MIMSRVDTISTRSIAPCPGEIKCSGESRSLVMMSRNDAVPSISSARPSAAGSLEMARMAASPDASPISTTRECSASARASLIAVWVVFMPGSAPNTAVRRPDFIADDHAAAEHQHRKARDQDGRQLFRIGRDIGYRGARDHARIRRRRIDRVMRARFAIFGEIGLQQIALRFGVALERAQLHIVAVDGSRLLLELVKDRDLRIHARAGKLGVVLERARHGLRLVPDLAVEIGDLRTQFLDARMIIEERRGLLGKLRAQRNALLGEPANEL